MAQSRPPPVRVHTTAANSPPPLSPRNPGEKRHHSRRKSGKTEYVVNEKKSSRPATLSRRSTPQYVTKVGSSGRSHGHREREDEERGRDSGESFPQFWYVLFIRLCFFPFYGYWLEWGSGVHIRNERAKRNGVRYEDVDVPPMWGAFGRYVFGTS